MGAVRERARLTMTPPCSPDSTSAAPPTWPARWRARTTTLTTATKPSPRSGRSSPPSAAGVTRPCASSPSGSTAATSPTPGCPPPTCRPRSHAIPGDLRTALEIAAARIGEYHALQADVVEPVLDRDGVSLREVVVPVGRAGLYVPGGRAAYPSTVLMTAIPAQLAGVDELVLSVPPAADGRVPDATLAAAALLGITEVVRIGGAQAIAALAYGTESLRPVDVIVGPGNRYVALAKREVAGRVGIESFAGPSEVVVVADGTVPATFAAADLLAQAEHGPGGAAVLVAWDAAVIDATEDAIDRLLADAPRRDDIERDPAQRRTGGPGRRRGRRARRGERDRTRAPRAADRRPRSAPPARAQRRCGVPRGVVARRAR